MEEINKEKQTEKKKIRGRKETKNERKKQKEK